MHRSTGALLVAVVALAALVVVPIVPPVAGAGTVPATSAAAHPVRSPFAMTNVTYRSSVDRFPLSYEEVLPAHYRSSSSYPMLVYLHGAGSSASVVRGGSGNGLVGFVTSTTQEGEALIHLLANASKFGFIVIAPSPRSAQGFYVNSTCTGPEEQDTVDAIHHEESLRPISGVYLLGYSMGSLGALSLAGHRPGLVSGIALTGTITDAFEELAYHSAPSASLVTPTCGAWPSSTNATAQRTFAYLSVARFHPGNFSGIRIWAAAGAMDIFAPNNASLWPFEEANFTFLTSSCLTVKAFAEPANCTDPFAALSKAHPTSYVDRVFYEPDGLHEVAELDPTDMFQFFEGTVGSACIETTFPPSTFSACP